MTHAVATRRRQQCNPGKTGSRESGGHMRNTAFAHTGYTGQLPGSLDDKCNTTLLFSTDHATKACSAGSCLERYFVWVTVSADYHHHYPGFVQKRVARPGAGRLLAL